LQNSSIRSLLRPKVALFDMVERCFDVHDNYSLGLLSSIDSDYFLGEDTHQRYKYESFL
jgi:hypothetical protein